ncbi:hypothetical protein CkaCkLH20_06010 [Colletotrichum karsti]|uniref:Uncharacterized protein n=1 Tax=Colletotrichum karsti TaxID=1095194 RepID=A0A9P6LLI0_9PEZI|nr:uncharacterized protein CkaCkLH20_06010 [Colletotrichum karsti]KAF9876602.1 hypothetical protein CkaCkLH20_06010 [Colletotrichum karsti]
MHPTIRKLILFSFFILTATASASSAERTPFKCPTYIDTVVPAGQDGWYGKREPGDPFLDTMHKVHDTLFKCSSIKSLKLRVSSLGCSQHPERYNFPLKHPSGSHYPSQLEALDLEGYEFNEMPWQEARNIGRYGSTLDRYLDWVYEGKAWNWLKGLRSTEAQRNLTNLDLWLEAMDFSKIEKFVITPSHETETPNITTFVPHLKSLKSFKTYGSWAKNFILALPSNSLTHLSWIRSGQTGASILPILRHHAESLTSLEVREPETTYRQRRVMTPDQLSALASMCPNLKSLTFDINQNGTWGWDHLKILATEFPNLENATIFYEEASECRRQLDQAKQQLTRLHEMMVMEDGSNCKGAESLANPHLNVSSVREPFEFLIKANTEAGGKLRKVVFYSGGWERPWDGAMLVYDDWMDEHRSWAVCEAIEGDGGPVEGFDKIDKVEVGDKLFVCQDERGKRYRVFSATKEGTRATVWRNMRLDEKNKELLKRASNMEL